jgi:phosphotransferase system enzyme I (PtsI)
MCGEMAGDPVYVWILLALGVGELSMTPFSIPLLKRILRDSTLAEARELVGLALRQVSAAPIQALVEAAMRRRFPSEFEPFAGAG